MLHVNTANSTLCGDVHILLRSCTVYADTRGTIEILKQPTYSPEVEILLKPGIIITRKEEIKLEKMFFCHTYKSASEHPEKKSA